MWLLPYPPPPPPSHFSLSLCSLSPSILTLPLLSLSRRLSLIYSLSRSLCLPSFAYIVRFSLVFYVLGTMRAAPVQASFAPEGYGQGYIDNSSYRPVMFTPYLPPPPHQYHYGSGGVMDPPMTSSFRPTPAAATFQPFGYPMMARMDPYGMYGYHQPAAQSPMFSAAPPRGYDPAAATTMMPPPPVPLPSYLPTMPPGPPQTSTGGAAEPYYDPAVSSAAAAAAAGGGGVGEGASASSSHELLLRQISYLRSQLNVQRAQANPYVAHPALQVITSLPPPH